MALNGEANASDVEVHQLDAVVVACAEGDREADLPQRLGSSTTHSREGLAGAEPLERHVKKAEGFYGEQVEASTTVDEGLGNGHVADGGCAEHGEHSGAGRGVGAAPPPPPEEGLVRLGRSSGTRRRLKAPTESKLRLAPPSMRVLVTATL